MSRPPPSQYAVLRPCAQSGQTVDPARHQSNGAGPSPIHRSADDETVADAAVGRCGRRAGLSGAEESGRTGQHVHHLHIGPWLPSGAVWADQGQEFSVRVRCARAVFGARSRH